VARQSVAVPGERTWWTFLTRSALEGATVRLESIQPGPVPPPFGFIPVQRQWGLQDVRPRCGRQAGHICSGGGGGCGG
jgi:hypothetical protein